MRTRRSFTDEFKRDAVAMVLDDGNPIVDDAGAASNGTAEGRLRGVVQRVDGMAVRARSTLFAYQLLYELIPDPTRAPRP